MTLPRIAITAGEPAGIGPELIVRLAYAEIAAELIAIADPLVLLQAAESLKLPLKLIEFNPDETATASRAGCMHVYPSPLHSANRFGILNTANASYVIETLRQAAAGAAAGLFNAIVTAPVNKSVINDAGIAFSGHTEFFAKQAGVPVVMMLIADNLRVALATTHLPLSKVPAAINAESLTLTLRILDQDLRSMLGIDEPRITVLGLNPHAGEGGHLGREEIDIIIPVLENLRREGLNLRGPLPADSAFVPQELMHADAVLAMYHDQGLPVLKHAGFGHAVNLTLGLPWIRTSVDHGSALDLAGKGIADVGSLLAATRLALRLVQQRQNQ